MHGPSVQGLHQSNFLISYHLLFEQAELVRHLWLAEDFQLDNDLFLRVLTRLRRHFDPLLQRIVEILEVTLQVVPIEAFKDSLRHSHARLLVEGHEHVSVQLRVEPVLRAEKFSVKICGDCCVFGFLEKFGLHGTLCSRISFVIQIINVDLLIHALKIDGASLHSDFSSLL